MFRHTIFFVATALSLGGYATNNAAKAADDALAARLRAESKGIIIVHPVRGAGCPSMIARIEPPDPEGRYVDSGQLFLRQTANDANGPQEIILPAGNYGIVRVDCRKTGAQQGNIVTSEGRLFEPITRFRVGAGEVVDIGRVQLPRGQAPRYFGPQGRFRAFDAPSAQWSQDLATAKPTIRKLGLSGQ